MMYNRLDISIAGFVITSFLISFVFPACQHSEELAKKGGSASFRFSSKLGDIIFKENPKKNVIYSPVSIHMALSLLEAGSNGETRKKLQQITANVHENDIEIFQNIFHSLNHYLTLENDQSSKLSLANAIFHKNSIVIKPEFMNTLKTCFISEALDLPEDNEEGVKKVNKWVSDKTMSKIPNLLQPGSFDELTKLVLVNAIYMDAKWKYPFNKTEEGIFYRNGDSGNPQNVIYAWQRASVEMWMKDGYTGVVLPYGGDELEMILIIQDGDFDKDHELKKEKIQALFDARKTPAMEDVIELSVPKFSFRYNTDLKSVLEKLGLGILFLNPDFSRISDTPLQVDKAVHEAFIKVDEKGTEAAGATAVVIGGMSMPRVMKFDRPFVFYINHKRTGTNLFVGQVDFIENQ